MSINSVYENETKKTLMKKQAGFSLVELLVAMIIGLFLLAGITTSFLSSKKSSIQRDQFSLLEDNGRIALEIMSNIIEHTGYTSNIAGALNDRFMITPVASGVCTGGGDSVLNTGIFPSAPNPATTDGVNGDSLGIVFLGDSDVFTDCTGNELPADCQISTTLPTNTSRVFNYFFVDSNDNTLRCAGSRDTTNQVLAEGVENLQILYGIADDNKSVDRYVNASNVNGLWNNVVSIQIAVLVRALKETKDRPESISYSLLDTAVVSPNDRYKRAVFSTTINLRNAL